MWKGKLCLALLGDPVEHSLSPVMHREALEQCGLEGTYEALRVTAQDLPQVVTRLRREEYAGFNVTVPHKESILLMMDTLDDGARRVGAVNTAVREEDALAGYNTDATGLARVVQVLDWPQVARTVKGSLPEDGALSEELGHLPSPSARESAHTAVVLGAGGAARACVEVLRRLGWEVTVANRTVGRATRAFGDEVSVVSLSDFTALQQALGHAQLLLNATSCGMNRPEESPLPATVHLRPSLTVMDLVYAPLHTRLLRQAEAGGCRTVDGLALLAAQAADSFQLWTAHRLPDSFFRAAAEAALARADHTIQKENFQVGARA